MKLMGEGSQIYLASANCLIYPLTNPILSKLKPEGSKVNMASDKTKTLVLLHPFRIHLVFDLPYLASNLSYLAACQKAWPLNGSI